ncbi:hypothetical protein HBH64_164230 [Parastagonospora nodorum]|nr:hypothetical protein HBI01_164750 [Parastagonospora nodorum]KAH4297203.1 hypothetical protein HBI02_164850 [Parastagonospora nodorum]KAH4325597.1 hypothetical protein HBI00_151440 [Parastagonospora nodorum]KAH4363173.1 hypothetical protein HBH94_170830 [Parastagonospora nodorum]KAH4459413.1 hypothetical protein HBH90_151700 [Parastagonospora nodorum]
MNNSNIALHPTSSDNVGDANVSQELSANNASTLELETTDFSVQDADTGTFLTEHLCQTCRVLKLGELMTNSTERRKHHQQHERIPIAPNSDCPLCRFLGYMVQNPASQTHFIKLECYEEIPRQYRFDPCIFKSTLESSKTATRYLLPSKNGDIDARPQPLHKALRPDSVDFEAIQAWMKHCDENHIQHCFETNSEGPAPRPFPRSGFRLIDCLNHAIIPWAPNQPYVALSYVWGTNHNQTEDSSASNIFHNLPKTVEDAMAVVSRLGYRYLWVDRYCIDQSNASEVQQQISAMDLIYQSAELTIIAAAGDGADFGLPGVRARSRAPQPRLMINGIMWASVPMLPASVVPRSTWNTRAWTFQEGYFARKRLIFTDEMVFFQCNRVCRLETSHTPTQVPEIQSARTFRRLPLFLHSGPELLLPITRPETGWRILHLIRECSKRNLSFGSDAIRAVLGVLSSRAATQLSEIPDGLSSGQFVHYWGLPVTIAPYSGISERVAEDLKSFTFLDLKTQLYAALAMGCSWKGNEGVRRKEFPTWTWAGWKAAVTWTPTSSWEKRKFIETDLPSLVCVQKVGGEYEQLNEHFMRSLIPSQAEFSTLYTYRLSMDLTLIDVKLSYAGRHSILSSEIPITETGPMPDDFDLSWADRWNAGWLIWDFEITATAEKNGAFFTELCTDTFDCAIMFGHYGLLLRTRNGRSERIGILGTLDGYFGLKQTETAIETDFVITEKLSHRVRCLETYFPTRKGGILLE